MSLPYWEGRLEDPKILEGGSFLKLRPSLLVLSLLLLLDRRRVLFGR